MSAQLNEKTIIVTGATGGIGSKLAKALDNSSTRLVLVGRDEKNLTMISSKLTNVEAIYVVDFTQSKNIKDFITTVKSKFDTIDILINASGVGVYKDLQDISEKDWDNTFDINVKAQFLLIRGLLPLLVRSKNPIIMNIGSGAGTMGMKGRSAYVASKFALRGLTLSLSEEFQNTNIKFTIITLGSTLTSFAKPSLEEKKKLHRKGKAYFIPEWVADKLLEILQSDDIEREYVLYPSEFGFGTWKKP